MTFIGENIESLWIEIDKTNIGTEKNYLIGVFYRKPDSDPYAFNSALSEILTKIKKENKIIYHVGDYNLDLLKAETHQPTSQFIDINFAHSIFPLIVKPTRITATSATLIDNIFTNQLDLSSSVQGIILSDISDHLPIFHILKHASISESDNSTRKRDFTTANKLKFQTDMKNSNWNEILQDNDAQSAYTKIQNILNAYLNHNDVLVLPHNEIPL